jgi:hypothetical protein
MRAGYSTQTMSLDSNTRQVGSPLFNENTVTLGFNGKTTFIVLKQINDLSLDRTYYYGRLIPAVEQFFSDWFSVRCAFEGSLVALDNSLRFGYGALGGFTFRIIDWGFDFDVNVTYRMKPFRIADGMIEELLLLMNFTLSDVFITRGK